MEQFIDFTRKTILIAGASAGIGQAVAVKLSQYGAKCALIARREDKLKETLTMMEGKEHRYFVSDLSALDSIAGLIKEICGEMGPLDGLVYCAGISPARPLRVTPPAVLQEVMNINFCAFYEVVRNVSLKEHYREGMRIVGISSVAAVMGGKTQSAYGASKAALEASVRILAQELAGKNIAVNSVRLGMIRTDMYEGFLESNGEEGNQGLLQQQFWGIGEKEDASNAILFLLSPTSRFITGANISVDGGFTCH